MNLTVILNHCNDSLVLTDTLQAIQHWVSDRIVLIDGQTSQSMVQGLLAARQNFPGTDWYVSMTPYTLFNGRTYLEDLEDASQRHVWCLGGLIGSPLRQKFSGLPLLETIINRPIQTVWRLATGLMFFNTKFIETLNDTGFFETIQAVQSFPFTGDFTEYMLPTMADVLGGKVDWFTWFESEHHYWGGKYRKYMVRSAPNLVNTECWSDCSVYCPTVNYDDYIRAVARQRRSNA